MPVLREPPRNKFAYVVVAAKRARQLQSGAPPLIHLNRTRKATRVAEDELRAGLLEYELTELHEWDDVEEKEKEREKEKEKEGKRRKG